MKQFLLPEPSRLGDSVTITGRDFHYLANVRRYSGGDRFTVLDPHGGLYLAEVMRVGEADMTLGLVEMAQESSSHAQLPLFHLYQGIPKSRKLDDILRQCCELGLASLTPLITEHTIPDLSLSWANKRTRLETIAREALQQSGHRRLAAINDPMDISTLCESAAATGRVFFFLHEEPDFDAIPDARSLLGCSDVCIIVGPEGGFSRPELDSMIKVGYHRVWLGPGILRTETAGIVALGHLRLLALSSSQ